MAKHIFFTGSTVAIYHEYLPTKHIPMVVILYCNIRF